MLGHHHTGIVNTGQHVHGVVDATVVDDDQLNVTGVADVEESLDCNSYGGCLVVSRYQDRQFQPSAPGIAGLGWPTLYLTLGAPLGKGMVNAQFAEPLGSLG
jgi:hypothetical protein